MGSLRPITRRIGVIFKSGGSAHSLTDKDHIVTAVGTGLITLCNATAGILAARLLGPEGRGILAVAIVWSGILSVVASLGLPQALTFFVASDNKTVGAILRVTLLIWAILSVAIVLIGMILVNTVLSRNQPEAFVAGRTYLYSIPSSMLVAFLATMAQGLKRFILFNLLRALPAIAYLLSLISAAVIRLERANDVVLLLLFCQIIIAPLALYVFVVHVRPTGRIDYSLIRPILAFGLKSYWGSVSWVTNSRIDQFLMSMFIGLDFLGYYAIAVSYATFLFPLSGIFAMVLFPNIVNAGGIKEAKSKIWRAFKSNVVLSGFCLICLGLMAPWLLPLMFGSQFKPAILPAVILLAATSFLGSNYILSDGLRGLGRPLATSVAELIGVVVTIIGLLILLPKIGIIGAALTSLASYGTVTLLLSQRLSRLDGTAAAK